MYNNDNNKKGMNNYWLSYFFWWERERESRCTHKGKQPKVKVKTNVRARGWAKVNQVQACAQERAGDSTAQLSKTTPFSGGFKATPASQRVCRRN